MRFPRLLGEYIVSCVSFNEIVAVRIREYYVMIQWINSLTFSQSLLQSYFLDRKIDIREYVVRKETRLSLDLTSVSMTFAAILYQRIAGRRIVDICLMT